MAAERRQSPRCALDLFVSEYVADRPHRCLATDISEDGLQVLRVNDPADGGGREVCLEVALPGASEKLWLRGEVCHESFDELFHRRGVRLNGTASADIAALRSFVRQRQGERLSRLLERVQHNRGS
jgi:hypothetical protein